LQKFTHLAPALAYQCQHRQIGGGAAAIIPISVLLPTPLPPKIPSRYPGASKESVRWREPTTQRLRMGKRSSASGAVLRAPAQAPVQRSSRPEAAGAIHHPAQQLFSDGD